LKNISKKLMIVGAILAVLCSIAIATVLIQKPSESAIIPKDLETTVFIATDIHLYSNNLISPDNNKYIKENFTSDGRIQEYDYDLMQALIDEVNKEMPNYLILTGDLTFNGEKDSHLELAKLLSTVNESTKVLVIPGNHDTYSQSCVSTLNDRTQPTESITADDFRSIYRSYGYDGAYSYDADSLSYIYKLNEGTWALMLDTTQSKYNSENGSSIVGGFVEEETLTWLEKNLQYAKENGISVISFTHHNLLVHNELFKSNYTLHNYEQLIDLYSKYDVSLNFSGHLHIQSIKSTEINSKSIHDVSAVSLLDYGNRYGRLDIYNNCYQYQSLMLNSSKHTNMKEYSFDVFYKEYYNKTLPTYNLYLGKDLGESATALLSKINAYYFDGSYKSIHELVSNNRELIDLISEKTPGFSSSYVGAIINVPNIDQHYLLIEK